MRRHGLRLGALIAVVAWSGCASILEIDGPYERSSGSTGGTSGTAGVGGIGGNPVENGGNAGEISSGNGGVGGAGGNGGQNMGGSGGENSGGGGVGDCIDGEKVSCYDGEPATRGVGACVEGVKNCLSGQWSTCSGQVLPVDDECNGVDDDCDGTSDDNIPPISCGVGTCRVTVEGCIGGIVQVCTPLPPNAVETCDGADDNCDGQVDEGCSCVNGNTQSCYTGNATTKGVGACADGTQTCVDGQWGACEGEVLPEDHETCDGFDNDCDDAVDEGLGTKVCGVGACNAMVAFCENGQETTCVPGQTQPETCNGVDDNCDGQVDDGLGSISCGVGECSMMVAACSNGQPGNCTPKMPSSEVCDGKDNDCNGTVDNGNPGGGILCNTGLSGVCAAGTTSCTNGAIQCNQNTQASTETCDGLDNDCNGTADNGDPGGGSTCPTGNLGECAAGTKHCQNGALVCVQDNQAKTETCDGKDNDCNGVIDNGDPGGGASCSTGSPGECSAGTKHCQNGALVCVANKQPATEICDGKDNDCNGAVDNGNPGGGMSCSTGQSGVCGPGTTACSNGAIVCNRNTNPTTEVCDGLDNDCNGTIDNGNPGSGSSCNTGQSGICAAGTTACSGGALVCNRNNNPITETCDGLDNDCNGTVDNGNPGGGLSCNTGQPGICAAGTTACSGGAIVCNRNSNPTTETCDGLDNDCNGTIDNGNPGSGSSCNTGQSGICAAGTTACSGGALVCNRNNNPITETCDGLDNDCNGTVDNGNPGGGLSCDTGLFGVCTAGVTTCSGGSLHCLQINFPSAEACGDGQDNDCDEIVDEFCTCTPGTTRACCIEYDPNCHTIVQGGLNCDPTRQSCPYEEYDTDFVDPCCWTSGHQTCSMTGTYWTDCQ